MVTIHNSETDEIVNREMNDDEFLVYEADKLRFQTKMAAIEAQEAQRAALLERLGITADEAKLLIG